MPRTTCSSIESHQTENRRGEVGAGILVIALAYGLGGPLVAVALLSLALNLLLTGAFILIVKRLLASPAPVRAAEETPAGRPADETVGLGADAHPRGWHVRP